MEKEWREHTIFKTKLYDISEVIMEIPREPEYSYKVMIEENEITLFSSHANKAIPYDTLKMLNFLTGFTDIRFESLLDNFDKERLDSIVASAPRNIMTLVDKNGVQTSIKTFYKSNAARSFDPEGNVYPYDVDRLFALVNEERDFVLLQYYVFDKVLRPLSYFTP